MKVLKFGGTSVADAKSINRVIDIILRKQKKDESIVVVVSALGGVTDGLIKIHNLAFRGKAKGKTEAKYRQLLGKLLKRHHGVTLKLVKKTNQQKVLQAVDKKYLELEKILDKAYNSKKHELRSLDAVMSCGEQLSAYIISEAVKNRGVDCQFVDARKLIKTDASFGNANVDTKKSYTLIKRYFKKNHSLSIMGGFIASTNRGVTTTLGRGGSDYTASLIGAALGASVIEIWTDVDGMLTADPRIVKQAKLVPRMSFEEAAELAYFGARVLHPNTISPAVNENIEVRILNSRKPKGSGTLITKQNGYIKNKLTALASKRNITIIDIISNNMLMAHGFLKHLFEVFDRFDTVIDVVTTSEVTVSVTIDDTRHLSLILKELKKFSQVAYKPNMAIISIVGEGLKNNPQLSSHVQEVLGQVQPHMLSLAAEKRNITILVMEKDVNKTMNRLHRALF